LSRKSPVDKYLSGHGEAEIGERIALSRRYSHVACIPACDEQASLPATLKTLSEARGADQALVIVVINARADAPTQVHQANQACAQGLRQQAEFANEPIAEGNFHGMGLVVVDRYSPNRRLAENRGVGVARKIAADLALAWMQDGSIAERWIHCTDADVRVPADYWEQAIKRGSGPSALVYPFVHIPEGDALQRKALAYYDAYLRYYVHGLKQAGSRHAYHSIGSLLCFDADAYAKVRGFPKRLAGEDFYLLNKLAKVGQVETLSGDPILLEGRTSDRVPFGTGVAVSQIREQLAQGLPYEVYNPLVFAALKQWLDVLDIAAENGEVAAFHQALKELPQPLGPIVRRAVVRSGSVAPVERAINEVQGSVLRKRLDDWHDAFRCLKMVHALRDEGLGKVPADELLERFKVML
jgi:hypothetical protein